MRQYKYKKDKVKDFQMTAIVLLLALSFVVNIGQFCQLKTVQQTEWQKGYDTCLYYIIPSQLDLQSFLIRKGYDVGPNGADGVVGEKSRKAWNAFINQRNADLYINNYTMGVEDANVNEQKESIR